MQSQAGAVCIDGSLLEGGGQILRNATALAAILGQPVHVSKIRAGRDKPGLSAQHLTGLQLVADISRGRLEGGAIRSTDISFQPGPGPPRTGSFTADTKTAGSCTLMVQQALPVMLFAAPSGSAPAAGSQPAGAAAGGGGGSCLTLRGGTDASFAPPIGYLEHVFLPTLRRLLGARGAGLDLHLVRRGFFPKGGGEVRLRVPPPPPPAPGAPLPAWRLTQRGHLVRVTGHVVTAGRMRPDIGERMVASARAVLREGLRDPDVLFGPPPASSSAPHGGAGTSSGAGGSTHAAAAGAAAAAEEAPAAAAAAGSPLAHADAHAERHEAAGKQATAPSTDTTAACSGSRDPAGIPSPVLDIRALHEPPERAVAEGGSVVLVAQTSSGCLLGASALAQRGVSAEAVGAMAARDLLAELRSGAAVDQWMQDQLIIFMALAGGNSAMLCREPTLHTRTAISVAEQLGRRARFNVAALPAQAGHAPLYMIECAGAGVADVTEAR